MRKDKVFWKKEVVGYLLNGRMNNFNLYGEWAAGEPNLVSKFIQHIEMEDAVCVGSEEKGWLGTVSVVPDDQIDIICRGSYQGLDTVCDKEFNELIRNSV